MYYYCRPKHYNPIDTNVCTLYMYQSSVDFRSGKVETRAYTYIVGYTKIF
jgi:hypothetical protein